ncbi:MAG: xanthine dehydrogenase family protein molybdopterin-binding subunit [Firmicutes bacterium]|jgi:CO/xanthine dehydrogenase Mo-binding subunit|nr:xanthine dehydrogenase family protein molybdopterin-binding subunit [Bacillota bacterium]MDH7496043.1 xanthine dehydrogenase family protein molybdopterin-binding subunit [Bacillota bacterium]
MARDETADGGRENGFCVVHRRARRVDAVEKVTGRAKFGADLYFDGMLHAKVLRAKFPHARLVRIDAREALKVPGVVTVLTHEDIPGAKTFGPVRRDMPVLAFDKTRYLGDGVAVVVADTVDAAEMALGLVRVDYEELPAVFSPEEAMAESAPVLHDDTPGNIVNHHKVRKGDVDAGFAASDIVIEHEYRTQFIEHAYIEPEAAVAVPNPNEGSVTVYGSVQNPFTARRVVAEVLGVSLNKVRIVQCAMGGSFGGKDDTMSCMCARVALAALKTRRPVKMVNSREESIMEGYKRHPYVLRYKAGATRDGELRAMEISITADAGAYASMTPFVTWRSVVQATGPYEVPNVKTDVYGVYTNNTYTGAMRGFGSPQITFAHESLMDELAAELGMDPLDLRLKNGFRQGSVTATGQALDDHVVSLAEVIRKAADAIGYREKRTSRAGAAREAGTRTVRGVGLAASYRGVSLGGEGVDATGAIVSVQQDGSVYVYAGLAENGQGLRTIFSQIAAEELGCNLESIVFVDTDTSLIPDGGPTVASRSTTMGGNAVRDAARKVRHTLLAVAGELLGTSSEALVASEGRIFAEDDPARNVSFSHVAKAAYDRGELMAAFGWYKGPKVWWNEERGQGRAYFTYVYGCQAVEVEVDTETGKVKVLKVAAAHDVGRAINPATVEGQIYGGVAMGLGYGLLEEVEMARGVTRTSNFDEYLIATSMDMPEVVPIVVENPDSYGPYGAKTIGEPTCELLAPAIANAVYHASGRRIRELPLDLERVLLGRSLKSGRGERGSERR